MKKLLSALALTALCLSATHAQDAAKEAPKESAKAPSTQQTKMATCNKDATDKKGDERKAFMKECLSAKPDGRKAQQEKMKTCNASATGKKGDERKAFMKECLSK
jgi:septal ring-binding cell division protein DamX